MRLLLTILLLLVLPPPPIPMSATFVTSTSAVIRWQQPPDVPLLCLYRYYGATYPAAICWEHLPAGPMRVELPGTLTHPAYRPAYGDRYELHIGVEVVGRATLGERAIERTYVPLVAR